VTLFSRGHHGMLYYDSKLFPEAVHPHLGDRRLLEHQAEACHRRGIDVNLYTTVCWDKRVADLHPEWICIDEDGALQDYKKTKYFEAGFYKNLCVNTGYRDFLKAQFGRSSGRLPRRASGLTRRSSPNAAAPPALARCARSVWTPKTRRIARASRSLPTKTLSRTCLPLCGRSTRRSTSFYNKGHVGVREKPVQDAYTYYAFESLPGGEWGYMDFPICAKYNRNFGKECLGMTGRFHTEWGDFHSFRNKEALEFECYNMLANGCKCIIGDQMHPSGVLNPYMYEQIGELYGDIERKEPWCRASGRSSKPRFSPRRNFTTRRARASFPRQRKARRGCSWSFPSSLT
jgi:hypothetical protein